MFNKDLPSEAAVMLSTTRVEMYEIPSHSTTPVWRRGPYSSKLQMFTVNAGVVEHVVDVFYFRLKVARRGLRVRGESIHPILHPPSSLMWQSVK